jgi:hypothetical protein
VELVEHFILQHFEEVQPAIKSAPTPTLKIAAKFNKFFVMVLFG